MSISIFPKGNTFLLLGFEQMKNLIPSIYLNEFNTVIINLEPETIREVLLASWIEEYTGGKVIFITDSRLLPLAIYYKKTNPSHVEVCNKSHAIKKLLIPNYPSLFLKENDKKLLHLTPREFEYLKMYFHGIPVKLQAHLMRGSIKTVYSYHYIIMRKFRIKKMQDLTAGHSYQLFLHSESLSYKKVIE